MPYQFEEVFHTTEVPYEEPAYAELARSEPCALCSEMTMSTKMVRAADGRMLCIPCSMNE
jgi:formylmethanofuran dehydrogenase subunit E